MKRRSDDVVGAPSSAKALDVAVIEDPAEFQDIGVLQGMRVVAAFDSADGALVKGAVLVDSGANEVVRPFQKSWFDEIQRGDKGKRLAVNMADGKNSFAVMTQHGEVMLPVNAEDRTAETSRWIVPTCRLIDELGCSLVINLHGMVVNFPDGRKIMTIKLNGLNFIRWTDFLAIKNDLAASHHDGRKKHRGTHCLMLDARSSPQPEGDGTVMNMDNETMVDMDSDNHWLE